MSIMRNGKVNFLWSLSHFYGIAIWGVKFGVMKSFLIFTTKIGFKLQETVQLTF